MLVLQGLLAALVIVGPVVLFSTLVGVCKDGSPLKKEFWT
jgi:hypothetical protein